MPRRKNKSKKNKNIPPAPSNIPNLVKNLISNVKKEENLSHNLRNSVGAQAARIARNAAVTTRTRNSRQQTNKEKRELIAQGRSGEIMQDFERIAMSLAVPATNDPQRWSSEFSSLPTAIASPWAVYTAGWNVGENETVVLPGTDLVGFLFRNAERAAVIYDSNSNAAEMTYAVYGGNVNNEEVYSAPAASWPLYFKYLGNELDLHTPYAKATSSYVPHGNTFFAGTDSAGQKRYFWMEQNTTLTIVYTTASTQTLTFKLWLWTPQGVSCVYAVTGTTGASQSVTIKSSSVSAGYYAVSVITNVVSGTATVISLTIDDNGGPQSCHLCIPGYDNNLGSIQGIRILAGSLMYSNEASPLNRQGKVVGYQCPQGTHWNDYVNSSGSGFSALSASQGKTLMNADQGMYGFLKPTKPSDFDIQSFIEVEAGILYDSFYPLDNQSSFLAIYPQISAGIEGAQDGYWTVAFGLEYQTSDVWRSVMYPTMPKEVYDKALENLKIMAQFHENPLHFSDIWNAIKKTAGQAIAGIQKYGPMGVRLIENGVKVAKFASKFI